MATMTPQIEEIAHVNDDQFAQVVDSAARYFLKMSGEEFVRRWQTGEFHEPDCVPGVMEVLSLLPAYQG